MPISLRQDPGNMVYPKHCEKTCTALDRGVFSLDFEYSPKQGDRSFYALIFIYSFLALWNMGRKLAIIYGPSFLVQGPH